MFTSIWRIFGRSPDEKAAALGEEREPAAVAIILLSIEGHIRQIQLGA